MNVATFEKYSGLSIVNREWLESPAPWSERIPEWMHPELVSMATSGMSGRSISRALGFHKNQIRRVLRRYPAADAALCKCGQSRKHQGWCAFRFANSEARQETLALMHARAKLRRKCTPEASNG